jgi:rhodanese-related sulfurtransferase
MSRSIPRPVQLVLALIIVVTAYSFLQAPPVEYGDVTVDETRSLIESKPDLVVLDVRTPSEYEDGHIEGAINIPVDELEERLGELDPGDELLVYCRTGNRSTRAVRLLEENGFTKVLHMNGGVVAWGEAGYSLVQ